MDKEGRYTRGTMKAAQAIEREQQKYDRGSFPLKNHIVCEIISRETSDKEMVDLLRDFIDWQATNADNTSRVIASELRTLAMRAEKLLTKIGETP